MIWQYLELYDGPREFDNELIHHLRGPYSENPSACVSIRSTLHTARTLSRLTAGQPAESENSAGVYQLQRPRKATPHRTRIDFAGLHRTALHCTALDCTALDCTALHCTALDCTALHWTWTTETERPPARCGCECARTADRTRDCGSILVQGNVGWDAPLQARCRGTSTRSSRSRKISRPTPLSRRRPTRIPCRTAPSPVHALTRARMHAHACTHACMCTVSSALAAEQWVCMPLCAYRARQCAHCCCRYWENEFARLNQLAYYNMCHFKVGSCCGERDRLGPIRLCSLSIAHLRTVVASLRRRRRLRGGRANGRK